MKDTYGTVDFYKTIKSQDNINISSREYSSVIELLHKKIIDAIIFDSYEYKIKSIGKIFLAKKKQVAEVVDDKLRLSFSIDRAASKTYGKKIRYENAHTNGYVFMIKFNKHFSSQGKRLYFKPNRYKFKRYLASLLKDPNININAIENV